MSRSKGRRAGKQQRQCSTSASFRDPFATSSWPKEAHTSRSREGDSRSCVTYVHSQSLSESYSTRTESCGQPYMRATAPSESPNDNKPNLQQSRAPSTNKHCFRMYFGPCSTKNKETPQQKNIVDTVPAYGVISPRPDLTSILEGGMFANMTVSGLVL
jgi:hypothetical protein